MHVHELNPWRTLIALSVFVVLLIVGFVTMQQPLLTYKLDTDQSIEDTKLADALFYPWQLENFLKKEVNNVVLFDIRDHFVFGQGHIPGAENLSAHDLTQNESIDRLKLLNSQNTTVVLYGESQLQANGAWMFFRQVGFDNVKVLVGGYQYYKLHKDDLLATKNDTSCVSEIPHYDFEEVASQMGATKTDEQKGAKKEVAIQRRKKTSVVAGGC